MKKRRGKTRSILLTQSQDERLNRLIGDTGVNRNQIVRLVAERATPEDINELLNRPPLAS